MNKTRKIDILYKRAHGQYVDVTSEENRELRKYKVDSGDSSIATKANIRAYVNQVDKGYRLSFYDYCCNNLKGDRRRKGGKASEIKAFNRDQSLGAMFMGWLFWGVALFWMFDKSQSVGSCAIMGAIVSVILLKCSRKYAGFTLILLPVILMALCAR